jgi:SnoaL-like protein
MLTTKGVVVTWKTLLSGVVCVLACVGVFSVAQAQQQRLNTKTPTLTAVDRLEIQELLHRYMFILDSCPDHDNGYEYADLYTEDGQFLGLKGREALARALSGRTSDARCSPIRSRGAMNQIHINVAPIIEPAPEGARGISYLLMIDGPGNEIYWNGWYQDVYARTPKGWRFKSRNHVGGGRAGVPADLSGARFAWERQPTPAGSRALVGASEPRGSGPIAGDPLQWLASGQPSMPAGR